jgi:chromosome segregation ATPase
MKIDICFVVFEISEVKKEGSGKIKVALIVCVILVVALVFSNFWLFRENEALIIEREEFRTEVDRLETKMASLILERDSLKDNVDTLVVERDEARAEVETLVGFNRTLTAGVEALIEERDSLKLEVAKGKHEIFLRDMEIDSLKGQISSLNIQIDELNDQIEELRGLD